VLLCADWVLPISSPPIADGAVLVVDGAIGAVGPAAELRARLPGEQTRTFPGCALLPGLVNVHTHLDYSAFRGFSSSCGFSRWILRLLRARRKLDSDDLAASALWGAYECARRGVTAIADTSYEGWTAAGAARAARGRARAGHGGRPPRVYLESFGLDDAELPATIKRLEARLERAKREGSAVAGASGYGADRALSAGRELGAESGSGKSRTRGVCGPPAEWGLSPHAPYTVSERLYREMARFARRAGLRMATHVAESRAEVKLLATGSSALAFAYKAAHLWTGQRWIPPGVSPVRYVAGSDALGPDTLVVHAVQVNSDDIATLAGSEAPVAHCPRSNLRLRCGIAPVAELRAAGITVGLGTDSLASNDSLDMFAEMRTALQLSREHALHDARSAARARAGGANGPTPTAELRLAAPNHADVLRMATLEGARALGWDHLVGSLEAGKRADIIALRLPEAELGRAMSPGAATARKHRGVPAWADVDPVAALVGAATADDVQMTMVEGAAVYDGAGCPADVVRGLSVVRAKLGLKD
jgi:cytosine/adenosine deaminase-related metal-dependent hydrolase